MKVKFLLPQKNGKKSRGGKRDFLNFIKYLLICRNSRYLGNSLANFRLSIYIIFISSENWQKVGGRQEAIAPLQKISTSF
ncbi:MAG: hypothetical protein F6K40_14190 [Okeania sp. SIO3I5]|uniref:hypothetical protein n=1 Tax=Okeania sp. SIO3I5 TaxID=2607805 RepID=UPI0013BC253D|nr:hypothetical protein [Okeania sp. SIO3I5]NEQ37353.1 hypothetical protein [Okeania sp. SIO3I5]